MQRTQWLRRQDTPQLLLEHHLKQLRLAHLPARVRQGGAAVRRRTSRLSRLLVAHGRTGVTGTRTPGHRTPHPAGPLSGGQDHGQLRLPRHPIAQQDDGAGAGAL